MAAYGVPQIDIAKVIDIAPKTLRKHFRRELDTGMIEAGAKVSENLFWIGTQRRQLGPAVTAGIWWEKTRLRWSDRTQVDTGNAANQPVAVKMDPLDAKML
jgi:hypothetical protein